MHNYSRLSKVFVFNSILFLSFMSGSTFAQLVTNSHFEIPNTSIVDTTNFGKTPVIVEAESGVSGSSFLIQVDGDVTFITTNSNY